MSRYKY